MRNDGIFSRSQSSPPVTMRFNGSHRMRQIRSRTIATVALSLAFVAHAHAQTQADMNAETRADFARADADLNKTYQSVLAKLRDPMSKQKLRETQRAWVTSRDAAAARAAKEAEGGSMAPTLRYETMTHLTQERINELKAMSDRGTESEPKSMAIGVTPSPASTRESSSEQAESVSPDKKWEYKCAEYGLDQCAPEIVRAGTTEVVLDLDEEQQVHGPEARQAEVIWALDSKRFAFNYSPVHAHHTVFQSVAF